MSDSDDYDLLPEDVQDDLSTAGSNFFDCLTVGQASSICPSSVALTAKSGFQRNNFQKREKSSSQNTRPRRNFQQTTQKIGYIPPKLSEEEYRCQENEIGNNFENYMNMEMSITPGDGVENEEMPPLLVSWDDLDLPENLRNNLRKLKMDVPTPIQRCSCNIIRHNFDCLAISETGQGKTAVFLIPIIRNLLYQSPMPPKKAVPQYPHVIVIAPTRELAIQIYDHAKRFTVYTELFDRIKITYGGASIDDQADEIEKGCQIIIATLGRLVDFVNREILSLEQVKYLVIDEADKQLMEGFEECLNQFLQHEDLPDKNYRRTIMTSATMTPDVQLLAKDQLSDRSYYCQVGELNHANRNIRQEIIRCYSHSKLKTLKEVLQRPDVKEGKTIIFTNQRRLCMTYSFQLRNCGIFGAVESIHGDRHQQDRETALRRFKDGEVNILVATDLIGRGIHIPNVQTVINVDLPEKILDYINRIGRTGRIGHNGKSISFYDPSNDSIMAERLCKVLAQNDQELPDFLTAETFMHNRERYRSIAQETMLSNDYLMSRSNLNGKGILTGFDFDEEW